MSFVQPADPGYRHARRIRQGLARIDPEYDAFIDQFRARYGFAPLDIGLDHVMTPGGRGQTTRLGITLERTAQYRSFFQRPARFDLRRQREVAEMFTGSVRTSVRPDELFVYFDDFERVARWEVHDSVSAAELADFTARLGIGGQFWCTERFAGPPIGPVTARRGSASWSTACTPDMPRARAGS